MQIVKVMILLCNLCLDEFFVTYPIAPLRIIFFANDGWLCMDTPMIRVPGASFLIILVASIPENGLMLMSRMATSGFSSVISSINDLVLSYTLTTSKFGSMLMSEAQVSAMRRWSSAIMILIFFVMLFVRMVS